VPDAGVSKLLWAIGVEQGQLFPWFSQELEALFVASPWEWLVTDGYRSREVQSIRHLKFGSREPGKSPHNHGCAVHVCPLSHGRGTYDIRHMGWVWLRDSLPPRHGHLHHGRDRWHWDHVEWSRWTEVAWGIAPETTL